MTPTASDSESRPARRLFWPLVGLLALVFSLGFLVFHHFLLVFAVAAPVALFLAPLQRRLAAALRGRPSLSAMLLTVACTVIMLFPIAGSATLLSRQAVGFFDWAKPRLQPAAVQRLWREEVPQRLPVLRDWIDFERDSPPTFVAEGLASGVTALNGLIQDSVAGLTHAAFDFAIFVLLLFFLLRDGPELRDQITRLSPLQPAQEDQVIGHLVQTVKGVLAAMVVVPVAQGAVALVGFVIFGVPSPLLWSVMVSLAALVPLVGSPLGWIPACIYLWMYGETWQWVGMATHGLVLISGIDNLIKPVLLRDTAQIHPLLGFLSILGGVMSFGPLGFLVGPVVLSLVLSALRIYRMDILRDTAASEASAAPAA